MKRILYIGYNFSPELTGIGKYSGEMMNWLAAKGHECLVVTSYPYYPQWKVQEPYDSKRYWYSKEKQVLENGRELSIVRCPMFVPQNPNGLKRIISDFTFFISASLVVFSLFLKGKYNYVISVAPSFLSGVLGAVYKVVKGSKHLHHIQDLQIEAAQELGLIKSKGLISILLAVERFVFKNSQNVSSISDAMIKRIEAKTNGNVAFLPNWVDTKFFFAKNNTAELKTKFGLKKNDFVVLYSGAIGEKQGLEAILVAAKDLKGTDELKFVICGSGPYKKVLEYKAKEMGLDNVLFFPLQPKDSFNDFLNMADIHLVIQKRNASDLVMPSKLTTILAVGGLALITADKGSELYEVVDKFSMGYLVPAENNEKLLEGLKYLIRTEQKTVFRQNAERYAREYLNIDSIMEKLDLELLK